MTLLLKNVRYLDWYNFSIVEGHVLVDEGIKGKMQILEKLPDEISPGTEVVDLEYKLLTKSFVNGHHHIYSTLARGMPMPETMPNNFVEILQKIWWKVDKALDMKMIEASALFAAMDAAKRGTTFIIDHHASPNAIFDSLDTIAQAFERVGVSHLLCYEISDRDGLNKRDEGLEETRNYLKYHDALVGLHASFTVSDETLERAVALAGEFDTGIHIHLAEDEADRVESLRKYGAEPLARLQKYGALDMPKSILGHAIHLNEEEKKSIAQSQAWIVQNMESNLNNKVGVFQGDLFENKVFLGTDGMHNDMLRSSQAAYFTGLNHEEMSPVKAYARLRAAHWYLSNNHWEGDGSNNLIVLDYESPTPVHPMNFPAHFIYGLDSTHIDSVIANGRFVVRNGKAVNVDEKEVVAKAQEQALRLWAKI